MTEVETFLAAVEPDRRKSEAARLDALFRKITGWQPLLYRGDMLGYGRYDYTYASGRSGSYLATGFSPRKAKLSIYIMPGYTDFGDILARLGKHSKGKSCLYLNKLEDADIDVLGELIRAGLKDLGMRWPVHPT
ncbi:DUF1801 domain-containing protein [Sulfitobacter aestuariivivens]|uniref:DUF1801 domain-containing protein n=1 Tax=Sulfitobacter aestuariivivens TaxID=2766981 RepID=A0A927HGV9_9RHOB|nr:DUF1801 domain-containing protein [Sulfitobacter aestuariivivens]MBD3665859.1 DUF1801 domain-containing protein [Sulfitobacter aestuariivivens]